MVVDGVGNARVGIRRLTSFVSAATLISSLLASTASAADASADDLARAKLANESPAALELVKRATELQVAGSPASAIALLGRAATLAPSNAYVARLHCEALTQTGLRQAALDACHEALRREPGPLEMRATVGALLRTGQAPKPEHLAEASVLLNALVRRGRGAIPTLAAECDLFEALEDWSAFRGCEAELRRLAPNTQESSRASATLHRHRASWAIDVAWQLLGLAMFITIAHRLGRWLIGWRRRSASMAVATMACVLFLTTPTVCRAETSPPAPSAAEKVERPGMSRWAIDDANPETAVPTEIEKNRYPLDFGYFIMELSDRAAAHEEHGDKASAVRYYRALAKAVPDRAVAYSKLCKLYVELADLERAQDSCRLAVSLEGSKAEDFERLADLILTDVKGLSPAAITTVEEMSEHLRKHLPDGVEANNLHCRLGLQTHDARRLQSCTEQLAKSAPDDPRTISYRWAYAVMRGDYRGALGFIHSAHAAAMPAESIAKMTKTTESSIPWWRRNARLAWYAALGVGVLGLSFLMRRLPLVTWKNSPHARGLTQ
ncbi:MAG TPA: hypothetical protein VIV60_15025 [Polyangiaceae bacterium]